jgi:hypothetical protein
MIRINVSTASTSVVNNLVIALYYSENIKWGLLSDHPPRHVIADNRQPCQIRLTNVCPLNAEP